MAVQLTAEGVEGSVNPGFFATPLKAAKSDLRLIMLGCSRDVPDRLVVRIVPVRVLEMWRLDFNGKVFAYGVQYEPQSESGGVLHRTLEYVQLIFYDVDGSGRFTVMRNQPTRLFQSLKIPEWAKRTSQ
jgi:hypothetical protein